MEIKTFDERLKLGNGDYDRLVNSRKPKGIDDKKSYIVGTGIAGLSTAGFLIKDAKMDPSKIVFLEKDDIAGGALDGKLLADVGYVARGGRETGHHFEALWDLLSVIPSREDPSMSILDDLYYTNLDDPNFSNCRITKNKGQRYDNGKFNLSKDVIEEILHLLLTPDEKLQGVSVEEVFSDEFLESDFWTFYRTMFAFENWHSVLELKLYINRFIHHVGGLPDLSALQFTRYDQYESIVVPIMNWLKDKGVQTEYNCEVEDIEFEITKDKKVATKIVASDAKTGKDKSITLTENDLVFVTTGSLVESSSYGDNKTAPSLDISTEESFKLWKNIAKKSSEFGKPEVFTSNIEKTNWESATVTVKSKEIASYIEKITKRSPYTGKVVTGGIVTALDSNWLMSWTINRQGQYIGQPDDEIAVWVYALFTDKEGDYIKKPMKLCTGEEIAKEWLYHIGVDESDIERLADKTSTIPVFMPYITAQFMPRNFGDRPYVVPKNSLNFAFLGQFVETLDDPGRDTVFTTEYSARCAMEAVYVLTGVEKKVPEVFASRYDIRYMLAGLSALNDGEKPSLDLPIGLKAVVDKKIKGTEIEAMLKEYNIL
ncbi:oleate hydratase [Peptoniphilus catoniae]|uniref:oleate hydratase n=1 Tax=Peptoniphilus catoniae TaxID=1660341 RepID=UPI0010FDF033|nr:oleate hydratase [Peptoniphilus catoniae]